MNDNPGPIHSPETSDQTFADLSDDQPQPPQPAMEGNHSYVPLASAADEQNNSPQEHTPSGCSHHLTDRLTGVQRCLDKIQADVASTSEQLSYLPAQIRNLGGRVDALTASISESRLRSLLLDLLGIFDLVDQLIRSAETTAREEDEEHRKNYAIIRTQIAQVLAYNGLESIPAEGDFQADMHRAVDRSPCAEPEQAGKIVKVVRPGFRTACHVLRYAEVIVSYFAHP